MSSITTWDWWGSPTNWDTPAGTLLRRFFDSLPAGREYRFTLYGSAPLQLTLNRAWLSADVDFFSDEDEDANQWVRAAGLAKEQADFYLEPGFRLSFRATAVMKERARLERLGSVTVTIPHPLDILIGKLDRLSEKDLLAFRRVIDLTGHPTREEFLRELQNAVDLFRPAFDEESPNRYPENAVRLWRELRQADLDVRRDIIAPALARRRAGYGEAPPDYKRVLREC